MYRAASRTKMYACRNSTRISKMVITNDIANGPIDMTFRAGHLLLLLFVLGGEYMLLHGGPALKVMSIGPFAMSFVMTVFEILVEFLQAYIFVLLAALYIAGSLADEH